MNLEESKMVRQNMKEEVSLDGQLIRRISCRAITTITLGLLIALGSVMNNVYACEDHNIAEATELAIDVDFESAVIKPKKKGAQSERLHIKLPSGKSVPLPIQYEGGKSSDRFAKIVPDPTQPDNNVLQFWLKNAEVAGYRKGSKKGRVQVNIPKLNDKAIVAKYRMYLHPDLKHYKTYPKRSGWFTISELWMGENWTNEYRYPFRISLGIAKDKGANKPLGFHVSATTDVSPGKSEKWVKSWSAVNEDFEVPLGEWLDIELGYRQGDAKSGRFYLTIKREQDTEATTIFDITNWTYSPNAKKPIPLTTFQPLKIYTSEAIISHIRKKGGAAQIYFDDFEIWRAPK